jgi:hypothetical protein
LINGSLFTLICFVSIVAVIYLKGNNPNDKTNFVAVIIDKHARLDSIRTNRIILAGGSNLGFGIDSRLIEKKTGKNVINLGLHGGLGSEFILNEVKDNVNENDIILLSLEYSFYDDRVDPYYDIIEFIQKIYPPSKAYYKLTLAQQIAVKYGIFLSCFNPKQINTDKSDPYSRNAFNAYGDDTAHLDKKGQKPLFGSEMMTMVKLNLIIDRLKELSLKCKAKHARLYLLYPVYAKSEFDQNHTVVKDIQKQININLNFITVLNTPEDLVFDDELFFDSVYHLNRKGRELRTNKLLDILKNKVLSDPGKK